MLASKPKKQFKKILLKGIIFLFLGILVGAVVSNFPTQKTTAASSSPQYTWVDGNTIKDSNGRIYTKNLNQPIQTLKTTSCQNILSQKIDLSSTLLIPYWSMDESAGKFYVIVVEEENAKSGKLLEGTYPVGTKKLENFECNNIQTISLKQLSSFQQNSLSSKAGAIKIAGIIEYDPSKAEAYDPASNLMDLEVPLQLRSMEDNKIIAEVPITEKRGDNYIFNETLTTPLKTGYYTLLFYERRLDFPNIFTYVVYYGRLDFHVNDKGEVDETIGSWNPVNVTIYNMTPDHGLVLDIEAFPENVFQAALRNLTEIATDAILFLLNWGKRIVESTIYLPTSQLEKPFITGPHEALLKLCNLLAVIGFLIIIFANLLRIELNQYAIKTMLPRLLLALVLMNFSLFITKVIVDLGNVFTKEAISIASKISDGQYQPIFDPAQTTTTVGGIIGTGAVSGFIGLSYISSILSFLSPSTPLAIIIFILVILLVPILIFLGIAFFMIIRNMVIWALAMVAPLAFIFMVLPFTQSYYKRWWSELACWTFKAPAIALLIGLSEVIVMLMLSGSSTSAVSLGSSLVNDASNVQWLIPFFGFAFLAGAFVVAQTSCRSFQGALNALLGRISSGFYASGWGRKFQIAGEMKKQRVQEELEKQVIDSKFLYRIPETQRVEKLAEIAKKDAARYQIMHPGEDIKITKQKAAAGNIQAQAYLLSIGEDFEGIDKVIDSNQGMAALANQTRPDLIYKDNQALREAIDRGQVDIARVQPQTIEALSRRGFVFNDLDVNTIVARAPHLTPYLVEHFVRNQDQINKLSNSGQKAIHRIAFKTMSDKSFQNYINSIGPGGIFKALSSFTQDDLKDLDFNRIKAAYNLLSDTQKKDVADHLNQILEKTHGETL